MTGKAAGKTSSFPKRGQSGAGASPPHLAKLYGPAGLVASLLDLQRTAGNQAVATLLSPPQRLLQAKLRIGQPGDAFEREADRVADAVAGSTAPHGGRPRISQVSGAGSGALRPYPSSDRGEEEPEEASAGAAPGTVQRKCECEPEKDDEIMQRREAPGATPLVPAGFTAHLAGLRGGGTPISPVLRGFFEPRFGHDFGAVRLHTGDLAERSADAVRARAFTFGNDLVFGRGEYAPDSPAGRHLLAHELTHVVQQGEGSVQEPTLRRSTFSGFFSNIFRTLFRSDFKEADLKGYLELLKTTGRIENDFDSDLKARQIVRQRTVFDPLSVDVQILLAKEMLTGFTSGGDEEAIIALFRAAASEERTTMRRAIGRDFLWGKFKRQNRRMIEALTLEAGDFQDPKVTQRLQGLSERDLKDYENVVDPKVKPEIEKLLSKARHELGSYPEEERKKISVLSVLPEESSKIFENAFKEPAQDQGGRSLLATGMPTLTSTAQEVSEPPAAYSVTFDSKIAADAQPGLKNIAAQLMYKDNLPPNKTTNLAIQAAKKIYRFSRFDHPGTAQGRKATPELLIEEVGALPGPAVLKKDEAPPPGLDFSVRSIRFKLGAQDETKEGAKRSNWQPGQWRLLVSALESFPDSILKDIEGVRFDRKVSATCTEQEIKTNTCEPNAAAETNDFGEATITLFDKAFESEGSPTRYGVSTMLERAIAHEIGHREDFRSLRKAFATYQTDRDRGKLKQARASSGVFMKDEAAKEVYKITDYVASDVGAFQAAAAKDGLALPVAKDGMRPPEVKVAESSSITEYGGKNVKEQFAELFSFYLTDPVLLQSIRPNIYQYFKDAYPKDPVKEK